MFPCFIFFCLTNKQNGFVFCFSICFNNIWISGAQQACKKYISLTSTICSRLSAEIENKSCRFFQTRSLTVSTLYPPTPPPCLTPLPSLQCVSGWAVWVIAVSPGCHDARCQETFPAAVLLPGNTSGLPRHLFGPAVKLYLITVNNLCNLYAH